MKQIDTKLLTILKTLPNSCVYAVISDSNMCCFISHSNNFKARIGDILQYSNMEYLDSRVVVFQKAQDLEMKLLLCERYKHELEVAGYRVINPRSYITYKVTIQYSKDRLNVFVVVYNRRRDKRIVGKFKNINDAKSFVDQYYSSGLISPVYAIGEDRYSEAERTR
jgi:hypothetical protein